MHPQRGDMSGLGDSSGSMNNAGQRSGNAAARGFYLGPWQEYQMWRARALSDGVGPSPTFRLARSEVEGRLSSGLSTDRRSSASSFSRSLLSISEAQPISARTDISTETNGCGRLRRAGVSLSAKPSIPPRTAPMQKPCHATTVTTAQDRIEKLRTLYGMSKSQHAILQSPLQQHERKNSNTGASLGDCTTPASGDSVNGSVALFSTASSSVVSSDAKAPAESRETQLLALLKAQEARQEALEVQLQRQQAVTSHMQDTLARLISTKPPPTSSSKLVSSSDPPVPAAAVRTAEVDSWLPVQVVFHSAPPPFHASPLSVLTNTETQLEAQALSIAHQAQRHQLKGPDGDALPAETAVGASILSGVDPRRRFIESVTYDVSLHVPSPIATTRLDSAGAGVSLPESSSGLGSEPAVSVIANPADMSPVTSTIMTASPTRRGSVTDVAADDLINWSNSLYPES